MVYKKKAKQKKEGKKMYKSKFGNMRGVGNNLRRQIHWFKRTLEDSQSMELVTGSNTPAFGVISFNLGSIPGITEFQDLYDQIRLCAVKVQCIPNVNVNVQQTTTVSLALPILYTAIDLTDGLALTTIPEIYEYESLKMTRGDKIHSRYFKPMVAADREVAHKGRPWIYLDGTSINDTYLGLKWALQPANLSTGQDEMGIRYRVLVKYYFCCRNVK